MPKESDTEGLKVFVRVRPQISTEVKLTNAVTTSGGVNVCVSSDKTQVTCSYDRVFDENSLQIDVFNSVKPLLDDVLKGINGTVFAYGQTSAGKSHTMLGPDGGVNLLRTSKSNWGLLPRASDYIFSKLIQLEKDGILTYKVKASYLQIYNETIYDLLRDTNVEQKYHLSEVAGRDEKDDEEDKEGIKPSSGSMFRSDGRSLKIREVPRSLGEDPSAIGALATPQEVYVSGLSEYRVTGMADVMALLDAGTSNRTMRSTDFNATSSRSHAILQLSFEIEHRGTNGKTTISTSKLSLADLAGSEKILTDEAHSSGLDNKENVYVKTKHLRELTSINTSLSCLGNVIAALTNKNRTHIPYRDSKLTRLLQDSLGGNTRTILLACVAPSELHTSETVNTLHFADRAKGVMLKVRANTLVDDRGALARANAEIARLQNLLANALAKLEGKTLTSPIKSNYTMDPASGIEIPKDSVSGFINGDESSIEYYLRENARLREENFELRATIDQQGAGRKKRRQHGDGYGGSGHTGMSATAPDAGKLRREFTEPRSEGNTFSDDGHVREDLDDVARTKEYDLQRANRKQRRQKQKLNRKLAAEAASASEGLPASETSNIVLRFQQASQLESQALSGSGKLNPPRVYGASSSLKTLRKARNSFDHDPDDALPKTNPEYFSGFLSALAPVEGANMARDSSLGMLLPVDPSANLKRNPLVPATINPYTGEPTTKGKGKGSKSGSSSNDNTSRKGSGKKRSGSAGGDGRGCARHNRLEAERIELDQAYENVQNQLQGELGVLDNIAAQRMSLERQLRELALRKSIDSVPGSQEAVLSTGAGVTQSLSVANKLDSTMKRDVLQPPSIRIDPYVSAGGATGSNQDLSGMLHTRGEGSEDYVPLTIDTADLDAAGKADGFVRSPSKDEDNISVLTDPEQDLDKDKENGVRTPIHKATSNDSGIKGPSGRTIGQILTPKKLASSAGAGGVSTGVGSHAANLRGNIQQASAAQALPSPTKSQVKPENDTQGPNPAKVNEQIEPTEIGLYYTNSDIGRIVQTFMFRRNAWVDMRIDDYDAQSGMHLLTSLSDGKSQMQDLRKKPVRFVH